MMLDSMETARSFDAREALHRIILVIRSTELFKLGANYAADHITTTSSSPHASSDYAVIGSPDDDEHISQRQGRNMSNLAMGTASFDVEAQQSLLTTNPTKSAETNFNARRSWLRVSLFFRSTQLFVKLGASSGCDRIIASLSPANSNTRNQGRKISDVGEENTSFNVEEAQTTNFNARQTWLRVILFLRSTQVFKCYNNPDSLNSPSYTSISSSPDQFILTQGSEIVAAHEISIDEDSTHVDILSPTARSTIDKYEENIELQNIQKKNVAEIVKKKDLQRLLSFGGVQVVAEALNTDLEKGISYSPNHAIRQPQPCHVVVVTFFSSLLQASNNYTIILLFIIAILSLVFGITEDGPHIGWLNGGVLIFTIVVLVLIPTIRTLWEKRSHEKSENYSRSKGRNLPVPVVRRGEFQFIHENDLVVGDIAVLRKGDLVPADGLLVIDQALELDEAGFIATIDQGNPFLLNYGSRVINGNARMLVTSTCMDTVWGEMMCQAVESEKNRCDKFEIKLHRLTIRISITGLMVGMSMMIVLFVRYKKGKLDEERRYKPDPKGEPLELKKIMDAIEGLIIGSKGIARVVLTVLSVTLLGITEGIAFVVARATIVVGNKIREDHNVSVRHDQACVNMGCVTTICTDKFGGLMLNEVEIDKFCVGDELISESSAVASNVLEGFCDGIGTITQTCAADCESKLVPLVLWAEAKLGMKRDSVNEQCNRITHNICNPFQECDQVVMEKNGNERYLHCRGPPRDILSLCSHAYNIDGQIEQIDEQKRSKLKKVVESMVAEQEAEVIAFACKCLNDEESVELEPNNLIYLGVISLKRLKVEDTKRAVATLREGGIRVVLASGDDDIQVLRTIGEQFGILDPESDDLVLEAEEFRGWSEGEKKDKVEKICIMGKCLPSDRILFIKCLQEKGQVVAVMAQKTADAPALKRADIGITLGTWSSQIARECSDISIWDISTCFGFLVNVVEKGRSLQENTRKFIQLELIITGSSLLINFTGIMFLGEAPISAVRLFWLNIVVTLVGGSALLRGPSTKSLMTLPPIKSSANFIAKAMWRNIAIQASYQTIISMALQHKGAAILEASEGQVKSMIYNGYFICQILNSFIAREPEKKNIFRGLFDKNWCYFWVATVLLVACQAVSSMIEIVVGSSPGLSFKLWAECLLIGLISWMLDLAGKFFFNFH